MISFFFFFNDPAPTEIYTLSLHDALPILAPVLQGAQVVVGARREGRVGAEDRRRPLYQARQGHPGARPESAGLRSEEHTSELQSRLHLVCRLLLEKKKKKEKYKHNMICA